MTPFKKAVAGGLAAVMLASSFVALSSTSASAQWRRGGWGWGPGVAGGVIGGLAVGALAAGAYGRYYPAYPYPYAYPPNGCYYAPQQVWTGYRWVVRRVEVCQ
jgi:hypothetical protein